MDHPLSLPIWDEIDTGLIYFWFALLMMVAMAVSFLLAHAIIPSLVGTRDLPQGFARLRPVFYASTVIFLLLALFLYYTTWQTISVYLDIYPRKWI
jgi:hypothetical protein